MSFVERAEAAMHGQASEGVQLLLGQRPPLLDSWGRRAVTAPLLAAFLWAAVMFQHTTQANPLEPIALFVRLLALAFTVRALFVGRRLLARLRAAREHARYKLALCDEGMLLRTPEADYAVAKEDILDIREQGDWGDRSGRRWADVYVITKPGSGRAYLALPPFFGATPGVLAERMMRWRGVVPAPETSPAPEPVELPSKLFDAAARGETLPGVAVLRHGRAYLLRTPLLTPLLGVSILLGWLVLEPAQRAQASAMPPLLGGLALLGLPLIWLVMTRLDITPRKGIALIITPAELLMRTRGGVHRLRFADIARFEIKASTGWSILQGAHPQRALVIHLKDSETVTYVEDFLGAPCEVVLSLCDGFRKGLAS